MKVQEEFQPTTVQAVATLEAKLGIRLPPGYIGHLLLHNGGRPERPFFRLPAPWGEDVIHRFLALPDGPGPTLENTILANADLLGPDLFPVAIDPFGNLIVLRLCGEGEGSVWLLRHDAAEGVPDEFEMPECLPLAGSFETFIERLEEEPKD